jgi:uncharacterized Zn finger protein (UPF0148 family)
VCPTCSDRKKTQQAEKSTAKKEDSIVKRKRLLVKVKVYLQTQSRPFREKNLTVLAAHSKSFVKKRGGEIESVGTNSWAHP